MCHYSLLLRFIDGHFDENLHLTIGVDFKSKVLDIDGNVVKLALWDTAGQERFRALTPSYYKDAHAVVLVYDVTNRESLHKLNMWLVFVWEVLGFFFKFFFRMNEVEHYHTRKGIVKMIVGNKTDKVNERVISKEEGRAFASRFHTMFLELSAKNNDGVQVAFEEIAQKVKEIYFILKCLNKKIPCRLFKHLDCGKQLIEVPSTWLITTNRIAGIRGSDLGADPKIFHFFSIVSFFFFANKFLTSLKQKIEILIQERFYTSPA